MPDPMPESPDAAPVVVAADPTPPPDAPPDDATTAPEHIWIGGGGYHPDLGIPGLFLGQGRFEALRYPDGHLELVGVTLPPLLAPGTLASAASDLPDSESAGNAATITGNFTDTLTGNAESDTSADDGRDADTPSPIPSPDAPVAASEALDTEEAPTTPPTPDEAPESHEGASEDGDAESSPSPESENPPESTSTASAQDEEASATLDDE